MADYRSVVGFVAFDPDITTAGEKKIPVVRFKMSGIGMKEQPLVSVTVWGQTNVDMLKGRLKRGDFVAVHGSYTPTMGKGNTLYHGFSAQSLVVLDNMIIRDLVAPDASGGKDEPDPF